MLGRIYVITCLETNKLYFGQTIKEISDEQRKQHSEKMRGWVPSKDWRAKHSRKIIEISDNLDKICFASIKEVCLKLGIGRKAVKRIITENKIVNGKRYMYEK